MTGFFLREAIMPSIAELSRRLADQAEAVCRTYLSNGCRSGGYWTVGDVHNTPGRSLFVRLHGERAGRWADAATDQCGDLLDLIAATSGLSLTEACAEATRFLSLPPLFPVPSASRAPWSSDTSRVAARRLFDVARPITGTLAEAYLRGRGLAIPADATALRFHPACCYRDGSVRQSWPALLAAVTDAAGEITGVQRTYLDPHTARKAPLTDPRRALGHLVGHAVRFHAATDTLVVGEGIETLLALGSVLPGLPLAACLSAGCLAGLVFPPSLCRLYIACDKDPPGYRAAVRLRDRGRAAGLDVRLLWPAAKDFNDDLRRLGPAGLVQRLVLQLAPEDAARFLLFPAAV